VRVWDAQTWESLEVVRESDDVGAKAAGRKRSRWRALRRSLETVIEPAAGGDPIAWFPAVLDNITTHPSGRSWAGSVGNHLYLIQLEGEPMTETNSPARPGAHKPSGSFS
jgi:hypothetical protein